MVTRLKFKWLKQIIPALLSFRLPEAVYTLNAGIPKKLNPKIAKNGKRKKHYFEIILFKDLQRVSNFH